MNHEIRTTIGLLVLIVGPLLLFLFRRSLAPLGRRLSSALKQIFLWSLPRNVVWMQTDSGHGKCPSCGSIVRYAKEDMGGHTFECKECGTQGTVAKQQ